MLVLSAPLFLALVSVVMLEAFLDYLVIFLSLSTHSFITQADWRLCVCAHVGRL